MPPSPPVERGLAQRFLPPDLGHARVGSLAGDMQTPGQEKPCTAPRMPACPIPLCGAVRTRAAPGRAARQPPSTTDGRWASLHPRHGQDVPRAAHGGGESWLCRYMPQPLGEEGLWRSLARLQGQKTQHLGSAAELSPRSLQPCPFGGHVRALRPACPPCCTAAPCSRAAWQLGADLARGS